jgi:hypothetical protein
MTDRERIERLEEMILPRGSGGSHCVIIKSDMIIGPGVTVEKEPPKKLPYKGQPCYVWDDGQEKETAGIFFFHHEKKGSLYFHWHDTPVVWDNWEPIIDVWAIAPPDAEWIAADRNNILHWFIEEPMKDYVNNMWAGRYCYIKNDVLQIYYPCLDWRESKQRRPR